ncbi:MAG TPA: hypothetical protein VGB04_13320 [Allosphingosinicella sp.]|jgi:hypothetical protein
MDAFEYYFSFFTLIIGLAVAAVARGFGTMWQTRRRAEIGWLTPLLAAFLLLDISRFWLGLWSRQEIAAMGPLALASVLCVALPYVFVTTIMFPSEPDDWASLDEYYASNSRSIFVVLLFSKIAAYVSDLALFGWDPAPGDAPGIALVLAPFAVLVLWASARIHRFGLAFLVAWSAFVFLSAPDGQPVSPLPASAPASPPAPPAGSSAPAPAAPRPPGR